MAPAQTPPAATDATLPEPTEHTTVELLSGDVIGARGVALIAAATFRAHENVAITDVLATAAEFEAYLTAPEIAAEPGEVTA